MSLYPVTVKRCQHIKVNGTQCGSPAARQYALLLPHSLPLAGVGGSAQQPPVAHTIANAGGCKFHTSGAGQSHRTSDTAGNRSQDGGPDALCVADSVHEPETNFARTGTPDAGSD